MADDMNDWAQPFGGHPQGKTPNIAKLAAKGVVFNSAHAAVPVCQPSRTAMLTGLRPHDSKIWGNDDPHFRTLPGLANRVTLPQYFMSQGYRALGAGKIFHEEGADTDSDSWDAEFLGAKGAKKPNVVPDHGMTFAGAHGDLLNWGPNDGTTEEQGDWQGADYIAAELEKPQDKPFFFAYGASKPHLAWFVPQKYFDMFPLDSIQLPTVDNNDQDDIPAEGRMSNDSQVQFLLPESQAKKNWQKAVQAYLANIAFADDCIGHVLDALERGPHKDNTIVLIMGDHGWHLGEKQHWGKATLWEEATRTPLVIYDPSIGRPGVTNEPVSLQDLYPTLIELNGLGSAPTPLAGHSLVPLLLDPAGSKHVGWALVSWADGGEALRTERWSLIRHGMAGGYQYELYDMVADQLQHKNLANLPAHAATVTALSKEIDNIIKTNAPVSTQAFEP
jgi:arylsulfatase A-like enzyme